jgi:Pyruvate/2-oxoacid:ferredoxin oxidoreductase gamma subunit
MIMPAAAKFVDKDAVKEIGVYRRVNTAMLGMYLFYRNSPLNRANRKRSLSETTDSSY